MSGRKKYFYLTHISEKKANFLISRGMKPTTRHGDFIFRLYSFQDLIIGLISMIVIFFYRSFCKVSI